MAEGLTVSPVFYQDNGLQHITISERDSEGLITVTSNASGSYYLKELLITSDCDLTKNATVDLRDFRTTLQGDARLTANNKIEINATASGKFDYKSDQGGYAQVNAGTVIKLKVADTASADNLTVGVVAYNGADMTSSFNITIENGYVILTAGSQGYPKQITLTYGD